MFYFEPTETRYKVETDLPETEWVARAKSGDEDAFLRLATHYRARVWKTASRFTRSRSELEDLTQDLFLKIWKGLSSYRSDAPFEHWLMRVTVRGCYDFLRKNRRRRELELLVDPQESRDSSDSRSEAARSRQEAWEIVSLLLEQLDAKDRTVITLLDLEEHSVKETAALTGWSESNVKVRAHRARKKMRAHFDDLGLER
ncbi:MAG: RNA polymerase sigma factor [Verrucomicrobiales bacterium]|nr:RNA polymerase sigma factor [Verrucomicrobiales bacterium]